MKKVPFVYDYWGKLDRALKLMDCLPYLYIIPGPTEWQCPLHGGDIPLVLPVDHPYWTKTPCQADDRCRCSIRSVGPSEYSRMLRDGVQDPYAPQVLGENGLPTGHRVQRMVPVNLVPVSSLKGNARIRLEN